MMIDYLIVIFRNYDLLDVQRKIFNNLFDKSEYRLIIVDNTPDDEKQQIYQQENELIVYRNSINEFDGISHGSAIDFGLQYVKSDIVCILDSDFFIINKNIHKYIEQKFIDGYLAVGAEFNDGVATIPLTTKFPELFNNIPCCFCGYYVKELAKSHSWIIKPSEVDFTTSFIEVGWKIRNYILNNKLKTLHWKTYTISNNNCIFEDNGVIMGLHNVGGSHRKVNKTYVDIISDLRCYFNDI